jgi:hypothetical protein
MKSVVTTFRWVLAGALAVAGCGGYRLPATEGVDGWAQVEHGRSLGAMRLKPDVCAGMDARPDYATLDAQSLIAFLKARGLPTRLEKAERTDLFVIETQINPDRDEWVRLRVAVLQSAIPAGQELHKAILAHGPGWWGVHRSNLSVLAPRGDLESILAFVGKTKLACWGVLTVAGADDDFVVPGGYREL